MSESACPKCGAILAKRPKRKTRCARCGDEICVRDGALLTATQAIAFDIGRRVGLSLEDIEAVRREMCQGSQDEVSLCDALTAMLASRRASTPDPQARRALSDQMAVLLRDTGRDHIEPAREAQRATLDAWRQSVKSGLLDPRDFKVVIVTTGRDSCPECRKFERRKFSLEEAEELQILPVPSCTDLRHSRSSRGWCRCVYAIESRSHRG